MCLYIYIYVLIPPPSAIHEVFFLAYLIFHMFIFASQAH